MSGYRIFLVVAAFFSLPYRSSCFGATLTRVVIWVEESIDVELVERIRGQTHDLPFQIVASASFTLRGPSAAHELELADLLAQREQATVVVWRIKGSIVIFIPRPAPGRLLIRPLATARAGRADAPAALQASSDLETGAVIVRSALLALAAGDEVGEAAVGPRKLIAPTPPLVVTARAQKSESIAAERWSSQAAFANLAMIALEDGLGHAPSIGGALTAGLRRNWASIGVVGEFFSSQTIQPRGVPQASRLSRQAVGLVASIRLLHTTRWQIALQGEAGAVALRLTTEPLETGREQTQQTGRGYVGTALAATVRLTDGPTAVSLLVGVGLRAVLAPPVLYAQADAVRAMNVLSPRVLLGLQISTNAGNP